MDASESNIKKLQSGGHVEILIKMLADGNPRIRLKIVSALAEIGEERTIEPLANALLDEDATVSKEAAIALCANLGSDNIQIYNKTWHKLSDIGRFKPKALVPFIEELKNSKSKHRANAVKAIGHIINKKTGETEYFEPTQKLLLDALSDNDKYVRKNAVEALGWIAFYKIPGYSQL